MIRKDLDGSEAVYTATLKLRAAMLDLFDVRTSLSAAGMYSPKLVEHYEQIRQAYEGLCQLNGQEVYSERSIIVYEAQRSSLASKEG